MAVAHASRRMSRQFAASDVPVGAAGAPEGTHPLARRAAGGGAAPSGIYAQSRRNSTMQLVPEFESSSEGDGDGGAKAASPVPTAPVSALPPHMRGGAGGERGVRSARRMSIVDQAIFASLNN